MIRRKKGPRRQRKTNLAALKRKLWTLFAAYVKERDGNVCFTCDKGGLEGQGWHAGHIISRRIGSTIYSPSAVFSQCATCNAFRAGNIPEFVHRYMQRFGAPKFEALILKSREYKKWTAPEIEELIAALKVGGAEYEMLYAERYGI